mmetsp:Transcript_55071/g.87351  ORF Transcript_55071/g.87351 Transcript_55071/m.87351 type:complete len:109 (-) Transcript_55071:253-579(-)
MAIHLKLLAALLVLLSSCLCAEAVNLEGFSRPTSGDECKTICQRFGMKMLGTDYGDDPTTCSSHCDTVFGSSLMSQSSKSQMESAVDSRAGQVQKHLRASTNGCQGAR